MRSKNDNTEADRGHVRALVLHHKADTLPVDPSAFAEHGCLIETAAYGAPALRLLTRKDFDALIVCVKPGHAAPTIAFVREVSKIWPWLPLIVYGSDSEQEIRDVAETLRTPHVLTSIPPDKEFCDSVMKTVESTNARTADEQETLTEQYDTILRSLPYLVQDSLQTPTMVSVVDRLGHALVELLPHDIISILGINDELLLSLMARDPINPQAMDFFKQWTAFEDDTNFKHSFRYGWESFLGHISSGPGT